MSTGTKRVVGVGLACLDQVLIWEDVGDSVEESKVVQSDLQGGGMAATAMVAVSRLGGVAELWTAVGDDWVGDHIVAGLIADGVDTQRVRRVKDGKSLLMVVCVDQETGERYFKKASDPTKFTDAVGDLKRLKGAGCLLIDHSRRDDERAAAQEAGRLGVPVVSDTGRFGEWQSEILPHVDYAIVSEKGAGELSDDPYEACKQIHEMGAGSVAVTLGDKGLVYCNGETSGELPAFQVDVVDTTGAGDVFHGAFCYGLVEGFPFVDNLRFASATSALKCQKIGGRAGIPTRSEVDAFLAGRG